MAPCIVGSETLGATRRYAPLRASNPTLHGTIILNHWGLLAFSRGSISQKLFEISFNINKTVNKLCPDLLHNLEAIDMPSLMRSQGQGQGQGQDP